MPMFVGRHPSCIVCRLRCETQLVYFDCIKNVVRGAKNTEFGVGGRCDIFHDVDETLVPEMFFDVMLFNSFSFLLGLIATRQTIHFGAETDEFHGLSGPGFALHLANDSVILF